MRWSAWQQVADMPRVVQLQLCRTGSACQAPTSLISLAHLERLGCCASFSGSTPSTVPLVIPHLLLVWLPETSTPTATATRSPREMPADRLRDQDIVVYLFIVQGRKSKTAACENEKLPGACCCQACVLPSSALPYNEHLGMQQGSWR